LRSGGPGTRTRSKAVAYEAQRQLALLEIKDELRQRNVNASDIKEEFVDITDIISGSESKIVQSALKQGGVALALKLPVSKACSNAN